MWLRYLAGSLAALALASPALAATRPRYGGILRVELHAPFESSDPPQSGPGMADLARGFSMTVWEGGRRAVFMADENAAGGRPFLDSVEIQLARPLREQALDLEVGKADLVELGPNEIRRAPAGRKTLVLAAGPRNRAGLRSTRGRRAHP